MMIIVFYYNYDYDVVCHEFTRIHQLTSDPSVVCSLSQGDSHNGVHQRLSAAEDHEDVEQHGHKVVFHHGHRGMFGEFWRTHPEIGLRHVAGHVGSSIFWDMLRATAWSSENSYDISQTVRPGGSSSDLASEPLAMSKWRHPSEVYRGRQWVEKSGCPQFGQHPRRS